MAVSKQAARTRSWIFGALLRLLGRKPYTEIRIANIAEEAGVARQSFYRNYRDKDDIIGKYIELLFSRYREELSRPADEPAETRALPLFFAQLEREKAVLLRLQDAGLSHLIYRAMHRAAVQFRGDAPEGDSRACYYTEYRLGGLLSVTMAWIERGMDVPPEQMGAYFRELTANLPDDDTGLFHPDRMPCESGVQ